MGAKRRKKKTKNSSEQFTRVSERTPVQPKFTDRSAMALNDSWTFSSRGTDSTRAADRDFEMASSKPANYGRQCPCCSSRHRQFRQWKFPKRHPWFCHCRRLRGRSPSPLDDIRHRNLLNPRRRDRAGRRRPRADCRTTAERRRLGPDAKVRDGYSRGCGSVGEHRRLHRRGPKQHHRPSSGSYGPRRAKHGRIWG